MESQFAIDALRSDMKELRGENSRSHEDILRRVDALVTSISGLGKAVAVAETNITSLIREQTKIMVKIEEHDKLLDDIAAHHAEERGAQRKMAAGTGGAVALIVAAIFEAIRHLFVRG